MNAMKMLADRAITAGAMHENIPSPCVSVCRMDAKREFCEGCLRSIEEIRAWSTSTDVQKKIIWSHITQRLQARHATTP